ncbi:hypothetical protein BJY52DRAFT_1098897, partial [Lactarius psammicola]
QPLGPKMVFKWPIPVDRLVSAIADLASCTASPFPSLRSTPAPHQRPRQIRRDKAGVQVPCCLSRRMQPEGAETYLEKHFASFANCQLLKDLIHHRLRTLHETLSQDKELTTNNTAIDIVGPGCIHEGAGTTVDFRTLEGSLIEVYLHTMQPKEALAPPPSAST